MSNSTEQHLLAILTAEAAARGRKSANALVKSITGNNRLVTTLNSGGSCTIREANRLLRALDRPELVSVEAPSLEQERQSATGTKKQRVVG